MAKKEQRHIFTKKIVLSICICILASCSMHRYYVDNEYPNCMFEEMCKTVGTIDVNTIKSDSNVRNVLCEYINEHPRYNTFVIMEIPIARLYGNDTPGIFIGPGYKPLYDDIYCDRVLDTINIEDVKTYIISKRCQDHIVNDDWKNTNPTDSIVIGNYSKRVSYYADENFKWRAWYIYKQNGEYKTIDRLDTVMFVKEVLSSINITPPVIKPDSTFTY